MLVMMPSLSSHLFPAVSRVLSKQQWVFPEGGSEGTPMKTPFQGQTGNCWALRLLAYQWNVLKFLLICFHSDSSFSRSYHNIFQNEFTLSFWSLLVSVKYIIWSCEATVYWYNLETGDVCWISLLLSFTFSPCFPGLTLMLKCMDLAGLEAAVYSGCRVEDRAVVKTVQVSTQTKWCVLSHLRFFFGLQRSSWFLVVLLGGVNNCCWEQVCFWKRREESARCCPSDISCSLSKLMSLPLVLTSSLRFTVLTCILAF